MKLLSAQAGPVAGESILSLGEVSPGLSAYAARTPEEAALVGQLLEELLLGQLDFEHRVANWAPGEARIAARHGELVLSREGSSTSPRLTLSPAENRPASAPPASPADWQAELPTVVLRDVFLGVPAGIDPLRPLLSPPVAEAFTRLASNKRAGDPSIQEPSDSHAELLARRDELASRIESLLATRREESQTLGVTLAELDAQRDELAQRVAELRRRMATLEQQLDADSARTRYEELSQIAAEEDRRHAAAESTPRVEQLDEEVARWRATLAELERRAEVVRGELARVRPEDAEPELLLADQRASIAVAQRLVADLESEVARFARSSDSPVCDCSDAHPRMNPLVETLGRHVQRLAELVAAQDNAQRTQELLAEGAQLERSQAELRRQIDYLLERRQTIHRSSRSRTLHPANALHAIQDGFDRSAVEFEYGVLREEYSQAESELAELDRQRDDLAQRQRGLLHGGELAAWQRELDQVQADMARRPQGLAAAPSPSLRASDVLATLTDGAFTELRLAPGGRTIEARDRSGRIIDQADLTTQTQTLVAWALRLALADSAHVSGVAAPLILIDPFAGLESLHAANLATSLDDYARRGRQVVLLTTENAGAARLRGLGVTLRSLLGEVVTVAPAPQPTKTTVRSESTTRAWLLDVDDPIERFPAPLENAAAIFERARLRTVGELITADPSALAEEIDDSAVTAELVSLWQTHACLVCFVAGLDLPGAKLLVDCDIHTVDHLADADAERLGRAVQKRGAKQSVLARVSEWIEAAIDGAGRWRSSGYAKRWARHAEERRSYIRDNAGRRERGAPRSIRLSDHLPSRQTTKKPKKENKLRFYLEVDSHIEAAPSIGPKRAERLLAIGVTTVRELLAADPEQVAERLGDERIDAARVVAWQHQAGLMIRVPGLRGHDAKVLVGSGFASAEEIAGMKPAELLEFVDPYCDTPEGERALRGSARPDLAEVAQWIEGARRRRQVDAA